MTFWLIPVFILLFTGLVLLPGLFSKGGVVPMERTLESRVFEPFDTKYLLVFFGYVGCEDICTPRLNELADVYEGLTKEEQNQVDVVVVNLKPLSDPEQVTLFSRSFHRDFHGIYLEKEILHRLLGEFGARYAPSLTETDEYDHTAFLYLLEQEGPHYRIKAVFTQTPFRKKVIGEYLFPQKADHDPE